MSRRALPPSSSAPPSAPADAGRPGFAARHPALVGGALAAAATALWVGARARRAERENPPIGDFIDIDGVKLHYVERGSGPAVVLLHGNTVLLQDFIASGLVSRLCRDHRVIAFDRPGFGHSERPRDRVWSMQAQAELLMRACRALGLEQPLVVGHSLGALVALSMALDHQAEVGGLVLVSGYYYPTPRLDAALTLPTALPLIGDVLRYTVSPLAARAGLGGTMAAMFAPLPVPDHFYGPVARELMLRPSQLRAVAEDGSGMVAAAGQLSSRLPELILPVTLVAGAEDGLIDPQAQTVRLHRELPQSRLLLLPGVGHMAHHAAVGDLVDLIDAMTPGLARRGRGATAGRLAGLAATVTATGDRTADAVAALADAAIADAAGGDAPDRNAADPEVASQEAAWNATAPQGDDLVVTAADVSDSGTAIIGTPDVGSTLPADAAPEDGTPPAAVIAKLATTDDLAFPGDLGAPPLTTTATAESAVHPAHPAEADIGDTTSGDEAAEDDPASGAVNGRPRGRRHLLDEI
ncbi:alpha/beta fold hydrolase [Derxia gummosa]|uniref:Alpha/beta fold hydrolase n=1 Tax=Derxia gummosa DSM 723 TaxID=1121388 RepID=A0A8B6XAS2_9BURK|nr:alpha/beta hydrolase [Derxia gummosa]